MATNGRNGNGSARTNGNGNGKPAAVLAVSPLTPTRPATAADHALAAKRHSELSAAHAAMAAKRARAEARKR